MSILSSISTLSSTMGTFLSHRLSHSTKHPPGPSWLDESEKEAQRNCADILKYLSFDSPRLMKKYGGIIRLGRKKYLIADPQAFKHILKTNVDNYTKHNSTYERIKLIFGQGLIVNEGPIWKTHRALLHPVFDRQKLENYSRLMTTCTKELLDYWQQNPSRTFGISKEIGMLTLKIAFKAFSNYTATEEEIETVIRLFRHGNPHVSFSPIVKPWMPTPGNLLFFHSIRQLNKLLQKIIDERKSKSTIEQNNPYYSTTTDALDILLNAKQIHNFDLSESEILDEYKTLLITGHETTGCGIAGACYLLARHPEFRTLMEEELETVLKGRTPTIDDCPNLPITKAIFLETLRLYPSIWLLPRRAIKADKLCGYDIPANAHLILNLYALHRNPLQWEDPEAFYPPRFLGEAENKRHRFSYLPFSVGPHSCIGSNFGIIEGTLLLAMVGQRFRLELVKPKDYPPEPYVSLRLSPSLKMRAIERPS